MTIAVSQENMTIIYDQRGSQSVKREFSSVSNEIFLGWNDLLIIDVFVSLRAIKNI